MTLDEAIKHCKEVAKNLYAEGDDECTNCAEEHEQLADWLEELQYLRKVVAFMRNNNVVGLVENYLREEANNDK